MPRAFTYPQWTPRTFTDGSLRWVLDEPMALRGLLHLGKIDHPEHFDLAHRREVHRTVTFPFTQRASDLFWRIPWRTAGRRGAIELYVVVENQSKPAGLARLRLFCLTGGVWQDDWATWERGKQRTAFRPLPLLPVLFYTGEEPWGGPPELATICRWPEELAAWAPQLPVVFVDLKREPASHLEGLAAFGRVLAVLQAENQPAAAFGARLRTAVQAIEQLPADEQALGRRWLWYLHALLHHRRPQGEHAALRSEIVTSVQHQDLRAEVETMGLTIAENLIKQGLERGLEKGLERGKRELLLHMIQTKFGGVPEDLKTWLSGLSDPATLEQLADEVMRAETVEQLQTYRTQSAPRKRRRRGG